MSWLIMHVSTVAFLVLFVLAAASSATALHEMKKSAQLELISRQAVATMQANQKEIIGHEVLKKKIYSLPDRDLDKHLDKWLRD